MNHEVGHEELMRYVDGESLAPERQAAIARHLERCTECYREYIVFRRMKEELAAMTMEPGPGSQLWTAVSRRIAQPAGWLLMAGGLAVLAGWAVWSWITTPDLFWRKLAIGAVAVGAILLLLSVILDRLRDLKTDPYREIQR